jgi:hypothetical protein
MYEDLSKSGGMEELPSGRPGIYGLLDRDESHLVLVREVGEIDEVSHGPRESVQLGDHDPREATGLPWHLLQELLKARAFEIFCAIAVVPDDCDALPAIPLAVRTDLLFLGGKAAGAGPS